MKTQSARGLRQLPAEKLRDGIQKFIAAEPAREPDSSKVLLPERMAMQRYLDWRNYRIEEGDGPKDLLTFAAWLGQSQVEILPPEWP
jgi:hypothetical protein